MSSWPSHHPIVDAAAEFEQPSLAGEGSFFPLSMACFPDPSSSPIRISHHRWAAFGVWGVGRRGYGSLFRPVVNTNYKKCSRLSALWPVSILIQDKRTCHGDEMSFGETLQKLRKAAGLSQSELATK